TPCEFFGDGQNPVSSAGNRRAFTGQFARRQVMSSMGRAPVRHPAPELPEDALRSTTELEGTPQGGEHMLAYMRLLWEHRRMLARVALYGLLSSAVLAFLIPNRYQSTARIMPPDSNQSGG